MQSVELTYAKYEFYKSIGIEINESNYKKLFNTYKYFQKQFKISKQELLEKFNYHKRNEEHNDRII